MTNLEALRGINSYPIPLRTFNEIAERRGLDLTDDSTIEIMQSKQYRLAYADLMMWLSFAPQVTQGGQSYNFSDEQRLQLRHLANEIYEELSDLVERKNRYGYKGSKL